MNLFYINTFTLCVQIVELLLENGARVDVFDHEGKTALHLAAEQGSQDVCKLLLSKNSFVNRYLNLL